MVDLVDDHVRHHIGVQRLASGAVKTFEPIFAALNDRLRMIVLVNKQTIRFPSKHALRAMLQSIKMALDEAYTHLEAELFNQLNDFTAYEIDFHKRLLERRLKVPITVPDATRIKSIAERGRIGEHATVGQYKKFEGQTVRATLRAQEARAYRLVKKRIMLAVVAARKVREAA